MLTSTANTTRILLLIAPALVVGMVIALFATDVPLVDEWNILASYDHWLKGDSSFADLWVPHNGHRIFLPRLLMFSIGWLTSWYVPALMWLGFGFALASAALISRGLAMPARDLMKPNWFALSLLISVLVFSLCQWENWLWGMQHLMFLALLSTMAVFVALTQERLTRSRFAVAFVLAWIASISFLSGLLVWPLGLLILAYRSRIQLTVPKFGIPLWTVLGVATITLYFRNWYPGTPTTPASYFFSHPFDTAYFFSSVIGFPLTSFAGSAWPPHDSGLPALIGAAGIVYACTVLARIALRPRDRVDLFVAALLLFSLAFAGMITLGRSSGGTPGALASRYTTLTLPFWIAIAHTLWLSAHQRHTHADSHAQRNWLPMAGFFILGALVFGSSIYCLLPLPARHVQLAHIRDDTYLGSADAYAHGAHPDPAVIRSGRELLMRRHLSMFRDGAMPKIPIALSHFRDELVAEHSQLTLTAGSSSNIAVRMRNTSDQLWHANSKEDGVYSVRLSYHWLQNGITHVYDGQRAILESDMAPGDSGKVSLPVIAPDKPGQYVLHLTLVQEGVAWFDAMGGAALDVPTQVTASD